MNTQKDSVPTRQQVLKGGIYLFIRRGASVILGFLGLLFINRIVGPGVQGLYSAAYGVFSYLLAVGLMGTNIYLIRSQPSESKGLFHLAFWWFLFYGVGLTLVAMGGLWIVGHYWIRTEQFMETLYIMCIGIPINLICYVPISILEQSLDYRRITFIEIISQTGYYIFAIPMALKGYGIWAMLAGFWGSLLIQVIGFFAVTRYRPVWYWDWAQLKPMLVYSFSQAASGWVYSIRNLLPAFLLLPLAGKEAVGYLNVANRFATMLSFAQEAAGRLSIPAFARVRNDLRRLARAVSEAMQLQTLALGASFACFTLVAPIALPILLGSKWNSQIILITFIILAVRLLLSALFAIQGNALYVRGQNLLMLYANIAYIVLFVGLGYAALLLIPEQYRLYGYVIADLIAHVPTYWLKHWGMVRYIGRPDYRITVIWTASMIGLLVAPLVSWWLYVPSLALLLLPASRQQLKGLLRELRQHKSSTAGPD